MIERKFVAQSFKQFHIKEYIKKEVTRAGLSDVKLQRTSMGDRIVVVANRPGLVVGRGGSVIKKLTAVMRDEFKLDNPQIEIEEVKDSSLDADIIAEYIVGQLERFGAQRFKGIGHKAISRIMEAGALGVEILITGRIPSSRSKRWRFAKGYMKKCGDVAITGVNTAKQVACLKIGSVGIQVKIMPGTTILPDNIKIIDKRVAKTEVVQKEKVAKKKVVKKITKAKTEANVEVKAEVKTETKAEVKAEAIKKSTEGDKNE